MNTYAIIIITGLLLFCAFLGGLALGVKLMAAESRDAIRFWRRAHRQQAQRAADAEQLLRTYRQATGVLPARAFGSRSALHLVGEEGETRV